MMTKPALLIGPVLLAVALCAGDASAGETSLALGDVAVPPESSGVDRAALRNAAEGELLGVDASKLRKRRARDVVVSVAVVGSTPSPFACTINALLYDAKTGTMLAIIQGHAHAEGAPNDDVRKRVLRAAMRSAVSQIPAALDAN